MDEDKDGLIDEQEMETFLTRINAPLDAAQRKSVFNRLKDPVKQRVTFVAFEAALTGAAGKGTAAWASEVFTKLRQSIENLRLDPAQAFERLVDKTDYAGRKLISAEKFKQVLKTFDPTLSDDQAARLLNFADKDESGFVEVDEFLRVLKPGFVAGKPSALSDAAYLLKLSEIAQYLALQLPKTAKDFFRPAVSGGLDLASFRAGLQAVLGPGRLSQAESEGILARLKGPPPGRTVTVDVLQQALDSVADV